MTDAPHILAPGRAPTPFTADEIREGCPAGRTIRLLVETVGETPFERTSRFAECDETGATLERSAQSLDGAPLGEPQAGRVTWLDLQTHASFPADATTIEPDELETPIGNLPCLRYMVREGTDTHVFWFARTLPGMPVKYLSRTTNETTSTSSVVSNTTVPVLPGAEAEAHGPDDSFELRWAEPDQFDELGLCPAEVKSPELLSLNAPLRP